MNQQVTYTIRDRHGTPIERGVIDPAAPARHAIPWPILVLLVLYLAAQVVAVIVEFA